MALVERLTPNSTFNSPTRRSLATISNCRIRGRNYRFWFINAYDWAQFALWSMWQQTRAVLFLYDSTDPTSITFLDDLVNDFLHNRLPQLPVGVVGLKADHPQVVPEDQIRAFCSRHGASFHCVASTGSFRGVQDFLAAVEGLHEAIMGAKEGTP